MSVTIEQSKAITRPLTHDEKKAAEAAFRGEPFHPEWSQAARHVYDGLVQAIVRRRNLSSLPTAQEIERN